MQLASFDPPNDLVCIKFSKNIKFRLRWLKNVFFKPTLTIIILTFCSFSLFFYSLTVSEIFEDYINNKKIKNVANIVLYLFAIIISVFTIVTSLNF